METAIDVPIADILIVDPVGGDAFGLYRMHGFSQPDGDENCCDHQPLLVSLGIV